MMQKRSSLHSGFTLFEMLAASTLASLLFVAVLAVVRSIDRERRLATIRSTQGTEADLVELLRWDLANARHIEKQPDAVVLSGNAVLNEETFQPSTPYPTTIVYQVNRVGGRSWLSRRQMAIDRSDPVSVALVCDGAAKVELTSIRPDPATAAAAPEMSSCVRLRIAWDDANRKPLDQIVVLR